MINPTIQSLAAELVLLATQKHIQICAAESCTGGALSAAITTIPGASKIFKGSIVSYSHSAKLNILKIPRELLDEEGEVSSIIAKQMMQSALTLFNADIGVGITGFAGPEGGGTLKYPLGTVFIALGNQKSKVEITQL
jgi:PncC family amidohydrolase